MTALAASRRSRTATAPVPGVAVTQVSALGRWPRHARHGYSLAHYEVQESVPLRPRSQARGRKGSHTDAWATERSILADLWLITAADPIHDADLQSALSDLEKVVDEAREEGLEPPSDEALRNAERLVRRMYMQHACRFEVYPTEDAEVAVSVPGGHRRSVLLLCDSAGGALCSVNLNGEHRRAVYDSAETLPDGFLREALAELGEE